MHKPKPTKYSGNNITTMSYRKLVLPFFVMNIKIMVMFFVSLTIYDKKRESVSKIDIVKSSLNNTTTNNR
jgi:hypothetical protein